MRINSDINILGGLPNFELVEQLFLNAGMLREKSRRFGFPITKIKTQKSIIRFEKAIRSTLLKTENDYIQKLINSLITTENISKDTKLFLFWNASLNNELLDYLNFNVFFPAYFSGRASIKHDEIIACLNELKQTEQLLKDWSDSTIKITASKYLTLLKKFDIMEGSLDKDIVNIYLSDKMLTIFVYWISAIETKSNFLSSRWMPYSFLEKKVFIERILQRRFSKFFNINYTGDQLKIELLKTYEEIYNAVINA